MPRLTLELDELTVPENYGNYLAAHRVATAVQSSEKGQGNKTFQLDLGEMYRSIMDSVNAGLKAIVDHTTIWSDETRAGKGDYGNSYVTTNPEVSKGARTLVNTYGDDRHVAYMELSPAKFEMDIYNKDELNTSYFSLNNNRYTIRDGHVVSSSLYLADKINDDHSMSSAYRLLEYNGFSNTSLNKCFMLTSTDAFTGQLLPYWNMCAEMTLTDINNYGSDNNMSQSSYFYTGGAGIVYLHGSSAGHGFSERISNEKQFGSITIREANDGKLMYAMGESHNLNQHYGGRVAELSSANGYTSTYIISHNSKIRSPNSNPDSYDTGTAVNICVEQYLHIIGRDPFLETPLTSSFGSHKLICTAVAACHNYDFIERYIKSPCDNPAHISRLGEARYLSKNGTVLYGFCSEYGTTTNTKYCNLTVEVDSGKYNYIYDDEYVYRGSLTNMILHQPDLAGNNKYVYNSNMNYYDNDDTVRSNTQTLRFESEAWSVDCVDLLICTLYSNTSSHISRINMYSNGMTNDHAYGILDINTTGLLKLYAACQIEITAKGNGVHIYGPLYVNGTLIAD